MNKNILNKNINKIFNKNAKYVFSDKVRSDISSINFKIKKTSYLASTR